MVNTSFRTYANGASRSNASASPEGKIRQKHDLTTTNMAFFVKKGAKTSFAPLFKPLFKVASPNFYSSKGDQAGSDAKLGVWI